MTRCAPCPVDAVRGEPPQTSSKADDRSSADESSHAQILKSSALIGASSMGGFAIGIVRTKAMATLLGPAGMGLIGIYMSLVDLAVSIAGLGVKSSGVRGIAEAVGSNDIARINVTVVVLRRISILLGLGGALLMILLSDSISELTFGSADHGFQIAILSGALFCTLVAGSQQALMQGMRRIADLASLTVIGALLGTLISVAVVYAFRQDGIVAALVAIAATSILTTWWYSRRIDVPRRVISRADLVHETVALLKLGVAFMASAFLMMGAAYAVRTFLLRTAGLDAAGLYQAAWTVGGLYVGLVLQAMGTDFYPRLVAAVGDHPRCNRLVNEQAHVSLLLAGPGVIATLTLAPPILVLLYSAQFDSAANVLRWICLGMMLRIVTWPIGFIIVAKGARVLFIVTEFLWSAFNVSLSWLCVTSFGLQGAGIAFAASYALHLLVVYPIVRRLTGFRWSAANITTALVYLPAVAAVFLGFHVLPASWAVATGVIATVGSTAYSIAALVRLFPPSELPRPIRWIHALVPTGRVRSE